MVVLAAVPIRGQYQELVTTHDGSQLYFSSSLRLRETNDPLHPKIFRADASGVVLCAVRQEAPPDAFSRTNFFQLNLPDIAADGSIIALNARRRCFGGSRCVGIQYQEATLIEPLSGKETHIPGMIRLSANGRYALNLAGSLVDRNRLLDLRTGESVDLPYASSYVLAMPRGRPVSSNGRAVVPASADGQGLLLVRIDGSETIAVTDLISAVIDDQASTIVYESREASVGAMRKLRILDLASGTDRVLAENRGDCYQPVLSDDGSRILFLSTGRFDGSGATGPAQVFVIQRDGSGLRQLTADPTGVSEATLSGNGRVTWLVTRTGRLFRLDVDSGEVKQIIGRTPALGDPPFPFQEAAPGSLLTLSGAGFTDEPVYATELPLPTTLAGVRVNLNGLYAPIFSVTPYEIRIQVPWNVASVGPLDRVRLEFESPPESAFEIETQKDFQLCHVACPQFERLGPEYPPSRIPGFPPNFVRAAHQNFESLVTPADPARPGEIVHVYMRGLGQVEPNVPDGHPGPSDPPARTVGAPRCRVSEWDKLLETPDTDVLYAGLAPGFVGVYQVSFRIPDSVPQPEMLLNCGVNFISPFTGQPVPSNAYGPLPVRGPVPQR